MAGSVLKGTTSYAFGFLAILLSIVLAYYFYITYDAHPYSAWLWAASIMAFLMFGIDKASKKKRVPGSVLTALALTGGFLGAWLGMFGFWHQVRRLSLWLVLTVSLLLHGAIIYYFFP